MNRYYKPEPVIIVSMINNRDAYKAAIEEKFNLEKIEAKLKAYKAKENAQ